MPSFGPGFGRDGRDLVVSHGRRAGGQVLEARIGLNAMRAAALDDREDYHAGQLRANSPRPAEGGGSKLCLASPLA
jgi:hypothetical protein